MSPVNESEVTRLPIPPKFPMEAWYMLSLSGLTPAQMKEMTMRYIKYLREIALAEAALYEDYYNFLDKLESRL